LTLKTPFAERLEANPTAQMVVRLDCAVGFTRKMVYICLFMIIHSIIVQLYDTLKNPTTQGVVRLDVRLDLPKNGI
jgi:hypothetical protein